MKLRIALTNLAIITLAVHIAAQSSNQMQDASRARAVALWEEVIKAKGGRERLHAVQNILIVSKVNVEGPRRLAPAETRKLYVLPDRAWVRASSSQPDVVAEAIVNTIDGKLCNVTILPKLALAPGLSPCSLTTWGTHLMQDPLIYVLETRWMQPKILGTRVEGNGDNRVDVIEAEMNELRVDFYLDRKTGLPFKLVTNKSDSTSRLSTRGAMTIKLSDYTTVDGIQMPRLISRESAARPSIVSRHIEQAHYSFNVDYDSRVFAR